MLNIDIIQQRLRELREQSGMTRDELAEKIGVTAQTIKNLEIKEAHSFGFKAKDLDAIADIFGVSTDYLLGRTNSRTQYANAEDLRKNTGLSEEAIENLSGLYWKGSQFDIGENSAISAFISHENFYEYVYQIAEAYRTLYRLKINEPYRKLDLRQEFHVDEQKIYHGLIYGASFILQNFIEKEVEKSLPSPATNKEKCSTEDTDNQEV